MRRETTRLVLHDRQVFVEHGGWISTITYSALPTTDGASLRALAKVMSSWHWT